MMSHLVFISIATIVLSRSYFTLGEYHWQDYKGAVPEDAIEGGYDKNGDSIYIAQVEVDDNEGEGVLVSSFSPKVPYVKVPINAKVIKVESGIKILCGSELPIDWLRADAENLHVVLIDKNPVRGGRFFNNSLHIGRIFYDNEIKIGPILSFNLNNANFYFVDNDTVLSTKAYEVLLYGTAAREHRRRPHRQRDNRNRFH